MMADCETIQAQLPNFSIDNVSSNELVNGNGSLHDMSTDENLSYASKTHDSVDLNHEGEPISQLNDQETTQNSTLSFDDIGAEKVVATPTSSKDEDTGSVNSNGTPDLQLQIQQLVDAILEKRGNLTLQPARTLTASEQLAKLLSCDRSTASDFGEREITSDREMGSGSRKGSLSGQNKTSAHRRSEMMRSNSEDNCLSRRYNPPTIPINDLRQEEWKDANMEEKHLRCHLASLYRLLDMHGWMQSIYNHISVKIQSLNSYLVNPVGFLSHEISASSLLKVDEKGAALLTVADHLTVNKMDWKLHSTIYGGRPDVKCIAHLHLPDVVAVSCMKCGLLPVSAEAEQLLLSATPMIQYHPYRGVLSHEEDISNLLRDLGQSARVLFLRNHGAIICSPSIEEAWHTMRLLVNACQAQTRLVQVGGVGLAKDASKPVLEGRTPVSILNRSDGHSTSEQAQMEFEAMMRLLDNAGYRTGYEYRQPMLMQRIMIALTSAVLDSLKEEDVAAAINTPFLTPHAAYNEQKAQENAQKIKQQVANNRQAALQRNQWLTQSLGRQVHARDHATISEEPELEKGKSISTSPLINAVLHDQTQSRTDAPVTALKHSSSKADKKHPTQENENSELKNGRRSSDHLGVSDNEQHHSQHKKGLSFASLRMPSFSKKKK